MATKIAFGSFVLDVDRGTLVREGQPIALNSKGLQLLLALLRAPGQVLSKAELMRAAWSDALVEESNLSVQIAALRKQLGPSPDGGEWLATIPRVGCRFIGSVVAHPESDGGKRPANEGEPRPSIAVLPFINLGGDRGQEYLADGITE